jgi:hypothetical protein
VGGFKAGVNTLQFVVLDESGAYTGLDFSATVTSPPCEPWWYSNKQLITEEEVHVATSGVLTFQSSVVTKEKVQKECEKEVDQEFAQTGASKYGATPEEAVSKCIALHGGKEFKIKCKKKDKETIYNPAGGRAGRDEVTEWVLSGCLGEPSPCPIGTKMEVISQNLPWPSHLIPGPPIRDVIENIVWEIKCSGSRLDTFTGTLMPTIGNSVDVFGAGSGEVEDSFGNKATVTGTEKLIGPIGDEHITAG